MRVKKCLILLGCLQGFYSTAFAASAAHDQLEIALKNLKSKDYDKAIAKAKKPLEAFQLNTVEDIILAHKILGIAYCELGDQPKATEHFDALVTFSPNETISEIVNSKPCLELFANVQKMSKSGQSPSTGGTGSSQIVTSSTPPPVIDQSTLPKGEYWHRYVPFGYGQFQNGEWDKGMTFFATGVSSFAISMIGLGLFMSEKGPNDTFENPSAASAYRGLFWGGLGISLGTAIWGIIDAVIVYNRKMEKLQTENFLILGPTSIAFRF